VLFSFFLFYFFSLDFIEIVNGVGSFPQIII